MVVTRNGEPVVVLISPAELESIEATLEVLSDPAFRLAGLPRRDGPRSRPPRGERLAERGAYVVLYDLVEDEGDQTVVVRRVEHRSTVYHRPLPSPGHHRID